jgi:hypothetical protein
MKVGVVVVVGGDGVCHHCHCYGHCCCCYCWLLQLWLSWMVVVGGGGDGGGGGCHLLVVGWVVVAIVVIGDGEEELRVVSCSCGSLFPTCAMGIIYFFQIILNV